MEDNESPICNDCNYPSELINMQVDRDVYSSGDSFMTEYITLKVTECCSASWTMIDIKEWAEEQPEKAKEMSLRFNRA